MSTCLHRRASQMTANAFTRMDTNSCSLTCKNSDFGFTGNENQRCKSMPKCHFVYDNIEVKLS